MKKSLTIVLVMLLGVSLAAAVKAQTITTVAGGGPNGIPATVSNTDQPQGVAVDSSGNVFVVTSLQVYKVDTRGQLTIYAGTGFTTQDTNGDGGLATHASFQFAEDIAIDARGNVFVTDALEASVRRIDATTHIITTYADSSDGISEPHSLAFDKSGNLFIADSLGVVWRVDSRTQAVSVFAGQGSVFDDPSPDGTPAASANIGGPTGVAVDSHGNVFVTDNAHGNLYRFDSSPNHLMKTVLTGLLSPFQEGIAVDKNGSVYIADRVSDLIKRWDPTSQSTTAYVTVAGDAGPDPIDGFSGDGGPATQAALASPVAVAVTSTTLYIADLGNNRVRAVDLRSSNPSRQTISTFAGNGTIGFGGDGYSATQASLFQPNDVQFDLFGNLFIADTSNNAVRRVDANTNTITTYAGSAFTVATGDVQDGGPATSGILDSPEGLSMDILGDLYIADTGNSRIRVVDPFFHRINTVAGNGFFSNGCDAGPATQTSLSFPTGVASDLLGNLYIADQNFDDPCVRRYDVFGRTVSEYADGSSFFFPTAVARDSYGNLYVTDGAVVMKVDTQRHVTVIAGDPNNLCSSDAQQEGILATTASLCFAAGVAVDMTGNVYVGDSGNNVVRKIDASTHRISTVAGNWIGGFSGDGGPATNAQLSGPTGVFVDSSGNLFIADFGNNRIRKVALSQHH